jgi:hypothetical protein
VSFRKACFLGNVERRKPHRIFVIARSTTNGRGMDRSINCVLQLAPFQKPVSRLCAEPHASDHHGKQNTDQHGRVATCIACDRAKGSGRELCDRYQSRWRFRSQGKHECRLTSAEPVPLLIGATFVTNISGKD